MNKEMTVGELMGETHHAFPFLKPEMRKGLTYFDIFLNGKKLDYLIVGSIALKSLGVPVNREPEDVDMEVICDERQEEIFRELAEAQGNSLFREKDEDFGHKPYVFELYDTKFNVWAVREKFSHANILNKERFKIPAINGILERKAKYHRPKDLEDLLFVSQKLMTLIIGEKNLGKYMEKINIKDIENEILKDKV